MPRQVLERARNHATFLSARPQIAPQCLRKGLGSHVPLDGFRDLLRPTR